MMTTTKAYKGLAMEGPIASWYAKITLKDIHRHQLMAARMVKHISPGGHVLEIAPGPGYFCIELARLGQFHITGLDISQSFVEIARNNAAAAGIQADFRRGDASDLPFDTASFDFIFCQAAFKNFSRPVAAIAEMQRVLRPGGVSVISDLRRDASPSDIEREVKGMRLGRLDEIFTRWTFRQVLLKNAYTLEEMYAMIAQTPFAKARIDLDGIGFLACLKK